MFITDRRALEIQRCDSCCRFDSDQEAQAFIAGNKFSLIEALLEFCGALMDETERAVNKTAKTKGEPKRLLKTIRDSLRNAVGLQFQGKGHREIEVWPSQITEQRTGSTSMEIQP